MTDELNQIPWQTLYHASGHASDIPHYLRNLTHSDPKVIDYAYSKLLISIATYGSASPPAAAAFPYLLKLMLTTKGRTRTHVIDLVMKIIAGIAPEHPSRTSWRYLFYSNGQYSENPAAATNRAIIYPLVVELFPTLLQWLHDPDEDIAHQILRIVACCVAADGALWPQIYPYAVAEHRPLLRASYQLVAWASAEPVALAWVDETFNQSNEPLVKLMAALVIAQTAQPVPEAIYSWLIDTISINDLSLIENYNALGLTRRYWFDCALVLYHRPLIERTTLAERCLEYFETKGPIVREEDPLALLLLAFGAFKYKKSAIERADIHSKVVMWLAHQAFVITKRDYGIPQRILQDFRLPWRPSTVNGFLGLPNANHPGFE